jgi:hypothetical protein
MEIAPKSGVRFDLKGLLAPDQRRRLAWFGVALALAVEVFATVLNIAEYHADRAYLDFTMWRAIPLMAIIYAALLAHIVVVPAGIWLLATAIRRNSGLLGWRWWAGGLLLLVPIWFALLQLVSRSSPDAVQIGGSHSTGGLYILLLIPSLWILAAPSRRD